MAIAIDQTSVGFNSDDASSLGSVTMTTSSTVASGGFIVLSFWWLGSAATLNSVAGGGLTWAVDNQGISGGQRMALVSAQAPSGLASGTVITPTFSTTDASIDQSISGTSFTGVATSSPLDGTPPTPTNVGATTAWTTGSVALTAGSVLIGSSGTGFADSSTITAPSIEAWDRVLFGGGAGHTLGYRIEASAGSYSVAGTWTSGTSTVESIAVAYLTAPSGTSSRLTADHGMGMGRW